MDSRIELQLRKILGEDVDTPEPMSRIEELLAMIAEKGISSGGGGGTPGRGIQKIELTNSEGLVDTYTITYTDGSSYEYTITNGAAGANGDPGPSGPKGDDGLTPTIGENGNWFIGDTDTGKPSRGEDGYADLSELIETIEVSVPAYENKVLNSVNSDGGVFNENGVKGGYGINSSGQEIDSSDLYVTGFIPITKGDIVRIQDPGVVAYDTTLVIALYENLTDSRSGIGKTISDMQTNPVYGTLSVNGNTLTWDTSGVSYYFWENMAYMRLSVKSANAIVTINQEIANTTVGKKQLASNIKVSEDNLTFVPSRPILSNKKIVVFGDSIIGMVRDNTSVTSYTSKYTGATVYNAGFGGCRMSVHPDTGYAAFSMWALADAITTGDFSTQTLQAASGQDYFASQLAALEDIDFDAIDDIIIHYGTNDFGGGVTLDDSDDPDNTTTLCGALRYSLDKIISKYPKIRIHISVPLFRMFENVGSDTYENTKGNTMTDFVTALINTAGEYHLPIINGYDTLGINAANSSYYLSDGTHLSEPGRAMFGQFIGGCLISNK